MFDDIKIEDTVNFFLSHDVYIMDGASDNLGNANKQTIGTATQRDTTRREREGDGKYGKHSCIYKIINFGFHNVCSVLLCCHLCQAGLKLRNYKSIHSFTLDINNLLYK